MLANGWLVGGQLHGEAANADDDVTGRQLFLADVQEVEVTRAERDKEASIKQEEKSEISVWYYCM